MSPETASPVAFESIKTPAGAVTPNNVIIPEDEVRFHPTSYADPQVRVFWWRGEIYRGISETRAGFFRHLCEIGLLGRLREKHLLIGTELTGHSLRGFGLVLKHEPVPFVTYAYEWSNEMLHAAALTLLDLEIELAAHGLTLLDPHPWNILFQNGRPIYVDVGSIAPIPKGSRWPGWGEFSRFYVNPLLLMKRGHGRIARWLLHDRQNGVFRKDLTAISALSYLKFKFGMFARALLASTGGVRRDELASATKKLREVVPPEQSLAEPKKILGRIRAHRGLRRTVEKLKAARKKTNWSHYYVDNVHKFPPFTPNADWTPKHHSVNQVLRTLKPATVLDAGSNRGWYAQLAATLGSQVVAFDLDEPCVNQLFQETRAANLSILPLIMDFSNPSPGYGLCNEWFLPASQRFRCDLVMALALVHHLVFKTQLRFEQIVAGLGSFVGRSLLVEFISRDDRFAGEWVTSEHDWYTQENFEKVLRQSYRKITRYPSNVETRVLLLCEK